MKKFIKVIFALVIALLTAIGSSTVSAEDIYYGYTSSSYGFDDGSRSILAAHLIVDKDASLAYCFNHERANPSNSSNPSTYTKTFNVTPEQLKANCESSLDAATLYDAVMKVLYNGYPNDSSDIKTRYNYSNTEGEYVLTDAEFQVLTQLAIWHFTNDEDYDDEEENYTGRVKTTYTTVFTELIRNPIDPETGEPERDENGKVIKSKRVHKEKYDLYMKVYHALIDSANLSYPSDFKLNLYLSTNGNIQNLMLPTMLDEKTQISVIKKWSDNDNQDGIRPNKVKVQLLANDVEVPGQQVELSAANNWTATFENLDYRVEANGDPITYTVKEITQIDGYEAEVRTGKQDYDSNHDYVIWNSHTPETVDISGTKTWDDNDNQDGIRPKYIHMTLFADGKPFTYEKVEDLVYPRYQNEVDADDGSFMVWAVNNWKYEIKDLPKYKNGKEIVYTVKEESIDGYETTISGFDLTNTHKPETTEVSGTKTWKDNDDQDGKRPTSITVNLLADGVKVDSKKVTANDKWKYSFKDLPKYKAGKEIVYTVTEASVDGYEVTVSNFDLTNTHTPETTEVSGYKTWDDNDDKYKKRPKSITVNLLADGDKVDSKKVTADDDWKFTFKDLPKYKNGKEITYTISEDKVSNYKLVSIKKDKAGKFEIINKEKQIKIPSAGGTGVTLYYIVGVVLVLISALIFATVKFYKK